MKLLINLKLTESDKADLSNIPASEINVQKSKRETALKDVLTSGKPIINSTEILDLAAPEDSYDFFLFLTHIKI